MPEFASFEELTKHLNKAISESLKKEVGNEVKKALKEKIETEVYDKYEPKGKRAYQRKKENGGLLDDDNIQVTEENENTIGVRSTRTNDYKDDSRVEGTKDVAEIIEYGKGYTWKNSEIYKMQPYPRPYHQEAYNELKKTDRHVEALKYGLKKHGITVDDD